MPDDDMLDPTVATIARLAQRPVPVDAASRARVMLAVQAETLRGRPGGARRFGWLVETRSVRLSPLAGVALAAGLVGIGVAVGLVGRAKSMLEPAARPGVVAAAADAATPAGTPIVPAGSRAAHVKFVLVAPQASHVTVVGDFNNWNPAAHPMERTPTGGTWTVTVPLEAGRHEYSFVVDGEHWMPDPAAPLAPDDGFGVANSVLLVAGSAS
jgi:hypothetical protein